MKKLTTLATTALLAVALVGCASTGGATKEAAAPAKDAAVAPAADAGSGTVELLDGFEDGLYWALDSSAKDGVGCDLTADKGVTEGANALQFDFNATTWAVVSCNSLAITDWTGAKAFEFDVFNAGSKPVSMGMCLMDGNKWEWQQTPAIVIEPGQQTFKAGLTDGTFLTSAGGLHAIPAPNGVEKIAFVAIAIHKAEEASTVYIDNIRLVK